LAEHSLDRVTIIVHDPNRERRCCHVTSGKSDRIFQGVAFSINLHAKRAPIYYFVIPKETNRTTIMARNRPRKVAHSYDLFHGATIRKLEIKIYDNVDTPNAVMIRHNEPDISRAHRKTDGTRGFIRHSASKCCNLRSLIGVMGKMI